MSLDRRFSSLNRLYQSDATQRLSASHIVIVGVGGVGSWSAEAIARSGVGYITLIDLDVVAESNINRQIIALSSTLGENKVEVMKKRIQEINPECIVNAIDDFLTIDNMEELLSDLDNKNSWIIDATDSVPVKAKLIAWAKKNKIKLIVSGAAGGKTNPLSFEICDLSKTYHDPLCASLKAHLKRNYNIGVHGKKINIAAIFSIENSLPTKGVDGGLNCSGYGSIVTITATMGMIMAGFVINKILFD